MNKIKLDIVIPAYFEGDSILEVLSRSKNMFEVISELLFVDVDEDDTLTVINNHPPFEFDVIFVKNRKDGLHGAVLTGFEESDAPSVMMMPADDSWNAKIIDEIVSYQKLGFDIVCPSRFMKGGNVEGYPKLKYLIVRTAAFPAL